MHKYNNETQNSWGGTRPPKIVFAATDKKRIWLTIDERKPRT